jgi:photosystem II stability/assembly factor-like uncharacterized protein
MIKLKSLLVICALSALMLGLTPVRAATAPAHDMYLCATISRNYVIGSKLVTDSGIYRRNAEGNYQHFGINFPFVLNVAFDPRDHQRCYAVAINGVLQSVDGGITWGIGNSWDMTEGKDVCIDPNMPDHVYLALPDGVAVTRDRGATWIRQENGLPERGKYTQTIRVDRTKSGRVLAGCEVGIFLTDNGAKSWRRVLPTTETVTDIQQSPHDPKLWYATTQAEGVQVSRDGGVTWRKLAGIPSAEAIYNVAFDPSDARRMAISSWGYGVFTTEDGGATWVERNAGLPADHQAFRVGIDPDNGRLFVSIYRDSLLTSDDFGRTWKNVPNLDGSTVYRFVFVPKAAK